jgi:ABC-type multidrug transport system fused ATPase/permease subunit
MRMYRSQRPALAIAVALSVLQSVLLVPIGVLIGRAFDTFIPRADIPSLVLACAAAIALYLASGGLALVVRRMVLKVTKVVIARMRSELVARVLGMPRTAFASYDSSRVHALVVHDTERVDMMSNALVAQLLPASLTAALLAAVMLVISPYLVAILALVVPPLVFFRRWLRAHLQRWIEAFHRSFESFSRGVLDLVRRLDLVRGRGAEAIEEEHQRTRVEELREVSGGMAFFWSAYGFVQGTVATVAGVVLLVFGGVAVARGAMTVGALISFYVVMGLFNAQLRQAFVNLPPILEGAQSLARVHEFQTGAAQPPYLGTRRLEFRGGLAFARVSFGYGGRRVLREVDLSVGDGEIVAVTGANGAGKTTLVNLALGFYRPEAGGVLADGVPFEELDLPHLRRQIGVLHQTAYLVRGTVAENIAYGRPEAGSREVEAAARLAGAAPFIAALPAGDATVIGEEGHLLSGGERQRIALARALLGRPKALVLDEPTGDLDDDAVRALLANLAALSPRPAMLVVSHDPRVLGLADRVLLIRDGALGPAHRTFLREAADP